ncbi:MAG: M12 family metallo-peptidase [Bacteroidota bacterium]|nr:M12 family metallo-peptidase [Bacteroidota bacterium]
MLTKPLFTYLSIVVLYAMLFSDSISQTKTEYNLFTTSDNSSLLNSPELKKSVSKASILNINKDELKRLFDNKSPEIEISIPYSENSVARLNLKRFEVLSPDAKFVARTAKGNEEVKLNDLAVSYTGTVAGLEEAFVTITFSKDNVTGMLCTKNDNFVLGSLKGVVSNQSDNYIVYKERDLKVKNTFVCGTEENLSKEYIDKMRKVIEEKTKDSSPTDLYVAEIAIEIDYATYLFFQSSMQNTMNYVVTLMSKVSAIYMKEVNVKLIIPYTRVWTSPDPYTSTTSGGLLNQFRNEWNTNQQSVQRTLAHFISKRSDNLGGVAWLSGLCASPSSGFGYAFSNVVSPTINLPTFSYEVEVVAHELGHNFGSLHTFNCSWVGGPIDSCFTVEGGCYTGPAIAAVGTIMSYCFNNGSISFVLGFGPQPRAVIRSSAEAAGCMYISQRNLELGYPNGGEVFRTGTTVPVYWGSSLTGNVNIELSSNNGSSWQTVQNNLPADQRTYNWTLPYIATTFQAKMRIVDSSNPNEGDTCDGSFNIILSLNAFNPVSPPTLTRLEVSTSSTETQKFTWLRAGTDPTITYKLKFRKIGSPVDNIFISDNNGYDSSATIRKSRLDSLAQTLGTTGDSVRCAWRVWSFNGYDSIQTDNSFIITLIRTTVGINVISTTVPEQFNLKNNYPNPFNPSTNIEFDIPKSSFVELRIFDSRGSEVNTLVNEKLQPGSYKYNYNAAGLPSGVYFYSIKTNEYNATKKMLLIK